MSARPLLVSNDSDLIDDVLRLAAANAVEVHLATDAPGARGTWQHAPLVLVGGDAAMSLAGSGLGRRRDVVLVCRDPSAEDWKHAVVVGAEHVVSLPEGERWLIDRLADSGEGAPRNGPLLAVVGAGSGSGGSTLAVTLATVAARAGRRVLLIDGDRLGGGLDVVFGLEARTGVRWNDLAQAQGRLGVDALADALPRVGGVHVLTWSRQTPTPVPGEVVAAVLDVAARGFDLTVADVARHVDAMSELVLSRAERTLLVAAAQIRCGAAAAVLADSLGDLCARLDLAVRSTPRGLRAESMAEALGLPLVAELPHVRRLSHGPGDTRVPSVRDAYGRACAQALEAIGLVRSR